MNSEQIEQCFQTVDGDYAFARWNRPIAPVVFGVMKEALPVLKGAVEAVAQLSGVDVVETDPELGSNLMMFFVKEWSELEDTPDLDRLVPDLADLLPRLKEVDAAHYRFFRFDEEGGIKAAFIFLRMTGEMAKLPAETIALTNAVQIILTWGPKAFDGVSPLGIHPERELVVLKPDVANLIRAAYDPTMPVAARDASHALRLAARVDQLGQSG